MSRRYSRPSPTTSSLLLLLLVAACAGKTKNDGAVGPGTAPVEQIEMDPIKITAVRGPDGVHLETYDVDRAVRARRRGPVGEALRRRRP